MDRDKILNLNLNKNNIKKILESRSKGVNIISIDNIVPGIKFIIENPSISEDELIDGLLKTGCNFDFEDIKDQFQKDRIDPGKIEYGLMRVDISYAACAIAIMMYGNDYDRDVIRKRFITKDDYKSFYYFIRKITEDETYTKENIDKKLKIKSIKLKKEL